MLFFGRNDPELDLLSSLTAVPGPAGKSGQILAILKGNGERQRA